MNDEAICRVGDAAPLSAGIRTERWQPWALLGYLVVIVFAAGLLQVLPTGGSAVVKREMPLADYFPRALSGWTGEDRPLGETEAVSNTAKKILGYDDVFQRRYRKKNEEFVLYVAYWSAGKMPARDVATHIPDQCWVSVGWKRTAADYHFKLNAESRPLAPGQYREFDSPGDHEYVVYWHILDGKTILYSPDGPPSQLATIKSLLRHGMAHKGEQYFIRLSSQTHPEKLCEDPGFQAFLELVAPLGPGLSTEIEP
jgi:hypothetical protein